MLDFIHSLFYHSLKITFEIDLTQDNDDCSEKLCAVSVRVLFISFSPPYITSVFLKISHPTACPILLLLTFFYTSLTKQKVCICSFLM